LRYESPRRVKMLRITIHENEKNRRIELAGTIAGQWVIELEKAWLSGLSPGKQTELDMRDVTSLDIDGRQLLERMHSCGVRLVASGVAMTALVNEIGGTASSPSARHRRAKTLGLVGLVIGVLLSWVLSLQAQQNPPAIRLTLRDAVMLALQTNPQVAIANLNRAESQESRNIARAALLPSVSFDAAENVVRGNTATLFGGNVQGFPGHYGPFWYIQAGPGFSAPLFDQTLWQRWRASKEDVSASAAQQTTAREQNSQLVVSQYLSGLRASADVSAARSRLELAKALFDLASDQQKNGVGTSIDTLRANVQYQNELQRHSEAETQLKLSLYGLSRLLNLDPQKNLELTDTASFFETPEFTSAETIATAYEQRPELKGVLAQIRAAELRKRAAGNERLPRVSTYGTWTLEGLKPNSMIPAYQFGASVHIPLFTGGRIRAEIAMADLEIRKLAQSEQDLKNQIAQEVRTALARIESSRVQVAAANLGVTLAKEEVAQAQDRFRAGVANNIEVITGQNELARANDNQIAALYSYNQARADLARATGQMEALYSK
jgi:outer membrane protein